MPLRSWQNYCKWIARIQQANLTSLSWPWQICILYLGMKLLHVPTPQTPRSTQVLSKTKVEVRSRMRHQFRFHRLVKVNTSGTNSAENDSVNHTRMVSSVYLDHLSLFWGSTLRPDFHVARAHLIAAAVSAEVAVSWVGFEYLYSTRRIRGAKRKSRLR